MGSIWLRHPLYCLSRAGYSRSLLRPLAIILRCRYCLHNSSFSFLLSAERDPQGLEDAGSEGGLLPVLGLPLHHLPHLLPIHLRPPLPQQGKAVVR